MTHPLFKLARRIEDRNTERRDRRALEAALSDKRLARDIGLPHRPHQSLLNVGQ